MFFPQKYGSKRNKEPENVTVQGLAKKNRLIFHKYIHMINNTEF